MLHHKFVRSVAAVALILVGLLGNGSPAMGAAITGLRFQGADAGTAVGDYISDTGGRNTYYSFWIEVPPSATSLVVDLFDADIGLGGAADDANNLDRLRNAWNTTVTYSLRQPDGTVITPVFTTGSATLPVGSDNAWLNFYTRANPPAGHWELRVDMGGGDDVNSLGIRAHDGNSGAGGTEYNISARSFFGVGVNAITGAGTRNATFTVYPYVTQDCSANSKDFDFDNANQVTVGGQNQQITYSNRNGAYNLTIPNASMSASNVWANNAITTSGGVDPSGTVSLRDGMGIWTSTVRVNEVAADNANFGVVYVGNAANTTTPPTAQPEANTFRVYFPTDGGVAPKKPYLLQQVLWFSGPNPPTSGNNTTFTVRAVFVNPTPQAVTFSAARLIQIRVPNDARISYVNPSLGVSQGTTSAEPANNSRGQLIQWNPGTVAANSTISMAYRIIVRPTGAGAINVTGAGNGVVNDDTLGTRADYLDETGHATTGVTSFGGLCPLVVSTAAATPTPVTLAWMRAVRSGDSVQIDWRTDSEYRQFGFDVYGHRGDQWIRLNTTPIAGRRGASAEPQDYSVRLPLPPDVTEIALDDVASDGRRTRHPALLIGGELGRRTAGNTVDWQAIRTEHAERVAANPVRGTVSPRAYVELNADGLWRVRSADLAAAGVDFSSVPTAQLAVIGPDGPVAIRISGTNGASFGSSGQIEFYGRARQSLYGKTQTYSLLVDGANARRAREALGATQDWPARIDHHIGSAELARNRAYSFASPTDDPWYDTRMLAYAGTPQQTDFVLNVDALADGTEQSVAVDLWGETDFPDVENDHRFLVKVNGVTVGGEDFPGLQHLKSRFVLPDGLLQAGPNTVSIVQPVDQGVAYDVFDLERLSIDYRRNLVARNGVFDSSLSGAGDNDALGDVLFRDGMGDTPDVCNSAACVRVDVSGFSAPSALAYIVNGDQLTHLSDAGFSAGKVQLMVSNQPGDRLVIADDARVPAAAVRAAPQPGGQLASPPAQLLVIAHPDFAAGLATFVSARQAEGLSVRVVTTDEVYAAYSAGRADPQALKALLADAYLRGTRYALLVGGDTYDYDNNLGLGAVSFVPTTYTWTGDIVRYAPADSILGDIDADGLPDIAVGRWPVRTAAELAAVVGKTLAYATASNEAGKALFVSGGSQPELDFSQLSGELSQSLSASGWLIDQASVDGQGVGSARSNLLAAINQGRALTNFVGHSSVDRWTFDPLLTSDDVQNLLTNSANPTVIAQWGCWASYFVSPNYNSMAHRFLLESNRGAAAVVGASTLVDTPQQDVFIAHFLQRAGDGTTRLGDALDATRREFAGSYSERRDLIYGVNLLGDPTLRLRK